MIVDFFRHGTGLSKGCLDYLLGEDRARTCTGFKW